MAELGRRRARTELTALSESTGRAWSKSAAQVERERVRRARSRRSRLIATASTVVLLGGLAVLILSSPGWPRVRETFFSWPDARASFPAVIDGFWLNVKLFLVAEPVILVVGLSVAVVRGTRSPVLFPLRALAVAYVDLFRGVPTLLLVFPVGFGLPALRLQGVPTDLFWLGLIALTLSYGAYVAEVFRSGIESVHPSQRAAARSLGLSSGQTMRNVVLPQAIRRVLPPLLNDFVSLQKDTALVAVLGFGESLREAGIYASFNFNYTPYVVAAALFIALTVPLARVTDWLGARALARQHSEGAV
jgi:polar amino acid transport system permease protein